MKYKMLLMSVVMVGITALSGCQNSPIPKPASTAPPISASATPQNVVPPGSPTYARQVLVDAISTMNHMLSFNLDSDVINQYDVQQKSETSRDVNRWHGQESVDIANKAMHLSINIDEAMNFDGGDSSGNFFGSTVNTYFDKEYSYEQAWTSGYGNTGGVWQKSKLPEGTWSSGNQLSPLLELLKSANQPMLLRSDTINGQPCLVMNITPSVEAIANWVISQNPGSTISSGPSLSGKDMLIKTFKGGIFQLWITADTHLIMRADFAPHFAVTGDELRQSWGDGLPSASNITGITSDFLGQLVFSNYNQPVSIEVPAEALNAKAR